MRIDKSQVMAHATYINVLHLSFLICIFLDLFTQKLHVRIFSYCQRESSCRYCTRRGRSRGLSYNRYRPDQVAEVIEAMVGLLN